MPDTLPRAHYPWWVKFILFGLPTRASALLSLWTCLVLAMVSGLLGFVNRWFLSGLILLAGALGYRLAIRWVDRHGHWGQDAPQPDSSSKSG